MIIDVRVVVCSKRVRIRILDKGIFWRCFGFVFGFDKGFVCLFMYIMLVGLVGIVRKG